MAACAGTVPICASQRPAVAHGGAVCLQHRLTCADVHGLCSSAIARRRLGGRTLHGWPARPQCLAPRGIPLGFVSASGAGGYNLVCPSCCIAPKEVSYGGYVLAVRRKCFYLPWL